MESWSTTINTFSKTIVFTFYEDRSFINAFYKVVILAISDPDTSGAKRV